MEFIITFEEKQSHPDPYLRVHGTPGCGQSTFKDIAAVFDADGANPALQIPTPLGIGAVQRILAELHRRRAAAAAAKGGGK